jgi:2-dehydro-3-deoxyphosphooctonate aldolase (KDO 8-P synthase)
MQLCGFKIGLDQPFFLIAGNCIIESEQMALDTAATLREITAHLGINFIYKASFEKANRTSVNGFRGLGLDGGLRILEKIKKEIRVPILADVHEDTPLTEVAAVVDVLQTPAFLCRQTNFIAKVVACGKPVNMKKGQFLSPWEMSRVVEKARAFGNENIMVCERGYSFGYNNLVVDMRSLAIMRQTGCPVIFDVGHSVQLPGAAGCATGGQREFIPVLARAGVGVGVAGIFVETHPNPDKALCDGPNSLALRDMEKFLMPLQEIDRVVKLHVNLTQEL